MPVMTALLQLRKSEKRKAIEPRAKRPSLVMPVTLEMFTVLLHGKSFTFFHRLGIIQVNGDDEDERRDPLCKASPGRCEPGAKNPFGSPLS